MLKERVVTALFLLLFFGAALFLAPSWLWQILLMGMVAQGAVEWSRLSGFSPDSAKRYTWLMLALFVLILGLGMDAGESFRATLHLSIFFAAVMFWVFGVTTWLIVGWHPKSPLVFGVTGFLLLIPTALAMLDLRESSPWLLLFMMAIVWVADSAAYFSGRKFGRRKLAPSISPGKTWEGVFGALLAASVFVLLVVFTTSLHQRYPIIPGLIIATCWYVALSILGDLFESAIKRQAGLKDSGSLLPGHGGLLDRIDALTSTLPLAALALLMQQVAE